MWNLFAVVILLIVPFCCAIRYQPNWNSLDSRPLPEWYDEAKIGIFLHWGLYSVPSTSSEWFWFNWKGRSIPSVVEFMKKNYKEGFSYADFAPQFTAEFYKPEDWADLFKAAGAKYVVLTSKHHEGYTNWASNYSWNWNSVDTGPHRDLAGDLGKAIRSRTDLRFGLYYSLMEWFNPLYLKDKSANFTARTYVDMKSWPELKEIVNLYQPDVVWSDGDWEAKPEYWKSQEFLAWLYNESPVKDSVVVNDRWGVGALCKHGGFLTCADKYNPGHLQTRKWENCMSMDKYSWGFRRDAKIQDYLTIDDLIKTVVETISCGGNILINVGPSHDGRIVPVMEERLRQLGQWLAVNGEAIYKTKPWVHQNDSVTPGVWYTQNRQQDTVYVIMRIWPTTNTLHLGSVTPQSSMKIHMLGLPNTPISWSQTTSGIVVTLPRLNASQLPCQWAWVLKLTQDNDEENDVPSVGVV